MQGHDDDQEWLEQVRRGEPEGLRRIYQRHKDDLLTVAVSLLGERAAAEDCLHDVFVRFAGSAGALRLRTTLKGYLVTSVANRARDLLRRRRHEPAGDPGHLATAAVSNGRAAAEALIDREESARLHEALRQLPWEQREVIVLRLQGDLTFAQIARQTAISINTVQSRYRYGLEKLRALLGAGAER